MTEIGPVVAVLGTTALSVLVLAEVTGAGPLPMLNELLMGGCWKLLPSIVTLWAEPIVGVQLVIDGAFPGSDGKGSNVA